jgi:hypothetical protein
VRRALAWTFDCLPPLLLAAYAAPQFLLMAPVGFERGEGVGIFDPSTGVDPVLCAHLARAPDLRFVLLAAVIWIAVELATRSLRGNTLGEELTRAQPPAPRVGLLIDAIRYGLLLGFIATAAAGPRLLCRELTPDFFMPQR